MSLRSVPLISTLLLSVLWLLFDPVFQRCQAASVGNNTSTGEQLEVLVDKVQHLSSRLHSKIGKLSEKEHVHFNNYENIGNDQVDKYEYDHEAFLGHDGAHEFDDLDPEESKSRLSLIVDKIDNNGDGLVTFEEMRNWIRYSHDKYVSENVDRYWEELHKEEKDMIGWEDYRQFVYGYLDKFQHEEGNDFADKDIESYEKLEAQERQRWISADLDHDESLTKLEFKSFLHPEDAEHMKDLVVQETIDDIDKDKDGKVSLEEYMEDIFYHNGDEDPSKEEPDWVRRERESFKELRDHNNDGFLDREEIRDWVLPTALDYVEAEAKHLIDESDSNSDEMLTKEEILSNYDLFVGSHATDFGMALVKPRDEF